MLTRQLLFALLPLVATACQKQPPATSTTPPAPMQTGTSGTADKPPAPVTAAGAPAAAPASAPASGPATATGKPDPAPAGMPLSPDDPIQGVFTLAQATAGLPATGDLYATIDIAQGGTDLGQFTCKLYADKAPYNVANFVGLARGVRPWADPSTGQWVKKPFFDGLIFHRVIPGFMIQGGDPEGVGLGDAGYVVPDEWDNGLKFDKPGLLAMANKGGPFTAGSQFFITETVQDHLDPRPDPTRPGKVLGYTIFGECSPASLVTKIANVPVDSPDHNMPLTKVVMTKVTITRGAPPK
jgi:peptidyl-prolyl cis-trans isomerase A (cyclophilin A)